MELGYLIYFAIVFGLGGFVLLGLLIYFVRTFAIQRQAWTNRSPTSRTVLIGAVLVFFTVSAIPLRMLWVTSDQAISGNYLAEGTWGTAELDMHKDGSFRERWHFTNEYTGTSEGDGVIEGHWKDSGRDWFTRDMVMSPFKPLAAYSRNQQYDGLTANVEGYSGGTAINVDEGADITFFRK